MPALAPPPTTAYPSDPTALERERLDALYLELRRNYKSLMISRGIHRSRSEKQGEQLRELSMRLRSLAAREASVKAEAYAMLKIVSDVVEHLEDAGDEVGTAFDDYQLGRRAYNGGGNIARLVQAVIRFLNRWRQGKQLFQDLSAQQKALRGMLDNQPDQNAHPADVDPEDANHEDANPEVANSAETSSVEVSSAEANSVEVSSVDASPRQNGTPTTSPPLPQAAPPSPAQPQASEQPTSEPSDGPTR
jgi:hypothetical protein